MAAAKENQQPSPETSSPAPSDPNTDRSAEAIPVSVSSNAPTAPEVDRIHDTDMDLRRPDSSGQRFHSPVPPARPLGADRPSGSNDTLLSAPEAGDRDPEDRNAARIRELDAQLEQLRARVKVLELSRARVLPSGVIWLALMVLLVVAWLIATKLR